MPRRRLRAVLAILLVPLILGAAVVAAFVALLTTEQGLRAGVAIVQRLAPLTIEVDGLSGALDREFGAERLAFAAGRTTIEVRRLRVSVEALRFAPPGVSLRSLRADRVRVTVAPSAAPAAELPESIAAPVALEAARLAIGQLELRVGAAAVTLDALDARVAIGPDGYRIDQGQFDLAGMPVSLAGRLAAARPFAIDARGNLGTAVAEQPVQANWRASGNLFDLVLAAEVAGGGARGQATAMLAPMAEPPLKSLAADIDGIVPRAWNATWPQASLRLRAKLEPDALGERLAGPVSVVNHDPGTLDDGRVPLRDAAAQLVLSRRALRVDALRATLLRGSASGSAALQWDREPSAQAQLRLDAVDPAAIHRAARSLVIDGRASVRYGGGSTAVDAELQHRGTPAVDARLSLRLDAHQIQVRTADLALANGHLALRGTIGLTGERRLALTGTVERLEPGRLVNGVDALVNGELQLDALLAPRAQGRLQFELRDSRAFGRPLSGHGDIRLDAARQAQVDLALAVRSARLVAQGGLGEPGRSLKLSLDAPALDELWPGARGGITLDATATGPWDAPALDARLAARNLQIAAQRVQAADLRLQYSGGADGRIVARAELADHHFGDRAALSLRAATLTTQGVLSAHRIDLQATTVAGRTLMLGAEGGLGAGRWNGSLRELRIEGAPALQLAAAAPLAIGTAAFELGPMALDAAGARWDAVRFSVGASGWRSEGRFTGLRPQPLLALAADGRIGNPPAAGEALALRGEWQLALGPQADGRIVVERSGGDLLPGTGAAAPIGLRELRLQATLNANRLSAEARAASERGGRLDARLAAFVEHDEAAGWRLAPRRPWQLDADAELPSLAQVQAVLAGWVGRALRVDGRLAAQLRIGGTPAAMQATGSLSGDDLRVAWIEEGMRLEQGKLDAHWADDALVVDSLRFVATPRGRPKEARVAARAASLGIGTIEAKGRIGLRAGAGELQLSAKQLPVLQRPDRWVVASGTAAVVASRDGARLDGEVAVDAGYVEASRSPLPALSADVTVRRQGAAAPRPSRYPFAFDLGIDLGPAFRVKAGGLDARAEGSLRLRGNAGAGGAVAVGTIQAEDGRYEGFGQRLAIKRGRLNFQGNPENPALDVLAVREGLPVEVGITVTRSVANPLVRLYSDPPMADPDILSWLLYGHAGDQTPADNVALLQAALGALRGGGEAITSRLARSLGVDDVTLRAGELRSAGSLLPQSAVAGDLRADRSTSPGTAGGIVSIGKRIGEAITLSYEQAVTGTESVVQLTYRLSQRLYLVARAGSASAFELVYSWAFD